MGVADADDLQLARRQRLALGGALEAAGQDERGDAQPDFHEGQRQEQPERHERRALDERTHGRRRTTGPLRLLSGDEQRPGVANGSPASSSTRTGPNTNPFISTAPSSVTTGVSAHCAGRHAIG
jgi:hypothetical protein